jgi:hypothetical protein
MNHKPKYLMIFILLSGLLLGACRGEIKQRSFEAPEWEQPTAAATVEPEAEAEIHCTDPDPHPMGESIAEKFEVSYEQVMTWYCRGDAFSDILLALETAKLVEDQEIEALLERLESEDWEKIWADLDVRPE